MCVVMTGWGLSTTWGSGTKPEDEVYWSRETVTIHLVGQTAKHNRLRLTSVHYVYWTNAHSDTPAKPHTLVPLQQVDKSWGREWVCEVWVRFVMSVHLHLDFMTSLQFFQILKHFTDFKSQPLVSSVCSLVEIMDKTKSDALKKQLSLSWWKARVHTAVLSWTSHKTSCTLWDHLIIRLCPFENGLRQRFKMMDISLQKQLMTDWWQDWCRLHFNRTC